MSQHSCEIVHSQMVRNAEMVNNTNGVLHKYSLDPCGAVDIYHFFVIS